MRLKILFIVNSFVLSLSGLSAFDSGKSLVMYGLVPDPAVLLMAQYSGL